jgi:hypothetical protein
LPGINGDEAWYGVQAQRWASDETGYWRTPSGNLPGPMQLGALILLQSIFEPSFALLRIPSLVASFAAMAMAYAIGRRFFDRTVAIAALLLMAALPVNIAYARFGWDPSHLGLVILMALHAALAGRRIISALAFALALTVHPTAAFAGPFLIFAMLGRELETRPPRGALARIAPYAAALILALGLLAITTSSGQAIASLSGLGGRLVDPAQWAAFGVGLGRLLTGETIYVYVTGQGFGGLARAIDVIAAVLVMGLAASAIVTLRRGAFSREAGVLTGWLASLILFMLIAGPGALQPHFERYAVWLIAPTALALAILIRRLLVRDAVVIGFTAILAVLLLIGFREHYFRVLEEAGSRSASTFWTGAEEPKQAAHDQLAGIARVSGPIRVVAEDWWLYWPVRYLAKGKPIDVSNAERLPTSVPDGRAPRQEIFWLVYNGSGLDRRISATDNAQLRGAIDATGHPRALHIWWTPPEPTPPGAGERPSSASSR